ncbi:MAG: DUF3383 family protein [Elusimicrobia bacterium]|nr:DUF3383 family protein [Elusimicrobiota bacterium]
MSSSPAVGVSLANVISISVSATPTGLGIPNVNTILLASKEARPAGWAQSKVFGIYKDAAAVAADCGSESEAAAIADAVFAQNPNMLLTNGYLVIAPRIAAVAAKKTIQDILYTAIVAEEDGDDITIAYTTGATHGAEVVSVAGSAVSVQIASGVSTATEVLAALTAYNVAHPTALLPVSFSITGTAGTAQVAVSATHLAGGVDIESIADCIARIAPKVFFFGILIDEEVVDLAGLSTYVQTLDKVLAYASSDVSELDPGEALDLLRTALKTNTRGLYYGMTAKPWIFAAAYLGRALSADFDGGQVGTMNLKQLVGIDPDTTIDDTVLLAAKTAGVDVYPYVQGVQEVLTSGANAYWDQVYCRYWLKFALQVAGFNYLAGTLFKIPQTESGMDGMKDAYRQVLVKALANGYAAPGSWQSSTTFGSPVDLRRCVAEIGYYVYSTPVALQSSTDRADRKAPLVQIALKEAGAIHSAAVAVIVNP